MKITLIRHIKTVAPEGMCYGQTDVDLPSDYLQLHKSVASMLSNRSFSVIYSSPLKRCSIMAQNIAGKDKMVIADDRLKELNFGNWEGKMWDEIEKTEEASQFFSDYYNTAPPNGESFKDMINRVKTFIDEIKLKHRDQELLIFTHGGPIRAFYVVLNNTDIKELFKIKVDYGDIIEFTII